MNTLLKLLFLQLILSNAFGAEKLCEDRRTLVHYGKKVSLCFKEKEQLYLSPECLTIESCFKIKDLRLNFVTDQSPGFSLCYQSGGIAFFGVIEKLDDKIPLCEFKGHFVDQENLTLRWKSLNKSSGE
jgi:hypothetical protein